MPSSGADALMPAAHHARIAIGSPAVGHVAGALDTFCAAARLPETMAWKLRVALDEIVANIVMHGAAAGDGGALDVWFQRQDDVVRVVIEDDGPPFNPLLRPDPDVTAPLEAREPGGLGIALVKSLMDAVRYERTARNVLTLEKRIDDDPAER